MNNKISAIRPLSTASQMVSSVTSIFKEFIISSFPSDYFKHIQISGAMASYNEVYSKESRIKELRKKNPAISFRPELILGDTIGDDFKNPDTFFLFHDFGWRSISHSIELINDTNTNQYLSFELNRYKINFTNQIRVETPLQCWDLQAYIEKQFRVENMFYITGNLMPVELPNNLAYALAKDINLDLKHKEDLQSFIVHLNKISPAKFDLRFNNATGKFIISYLTRPYILVRIERPTTALNKINKSYKDSIVEFSAYCELSYPSQYYLRTDKTEVENEPEDTTPNLVITFNLPVAPPRMYHENTLIFNEGFISDVDKVIDELNLLDVTPDWFGEYVDLIFMEKSLINLNFIIYMDSKLLEEDVDYTIDLQNKKIILLNPRFNYEYRLLVYANQLHLKDFLITKDHINLNGIFDEIAPKN